MEIEGEDNKKRYIAEKEREYKDKFANPYEAAKYGYIDDVIEPRNSRFRIIRALQALATKASSKMNKLLCFMRSDVNQVQCSTEQLPNGQSY